MKDKIEDPVVRLSLASNPETDPDLLREIAKSEKDNEEICCAIAKNTNTPIDTLQYLFGWRASEDDGDYPYVRVTKEVINNPNLPISALEDMLDKWIEVDWLDLWIELSKLPRLTTRMIEKLSEKYYPCFFLIDLELTQNSPLLLDKLARHSEPPTLLKILNNELTPTSTLEYLSGHQYREIRNAVIAHKNVSEKALEIVLFMQGKPGVPVSVLTELVTDRRQYFLFLLAQYSGTTTEILEAIINLNCFKELARIYRYNKSYERDIIDNIINHPNISQSLLNRLIKIVHQIYQIGHQERIVLSSLINKRKLLISNSIPNNEQQTSKILGDKNLRYSWNNLYEQASENVIPF